MYRRDSDGGKRRISSGTRRSVTPTTWHRCRPHLQTGQSRADRQLVPPRDQLPKRSPLLPAARKPVSFKYRKQASRRSKTSSQDSRSQPGSSSGDSSSPPLESSSRGRPSARARADWAISAEQQCTCRRRRFAVLLVIAAAVWLAARSFRIQDVGQAPHWIHYLRRPLGWCFPPGVLWRL